MTALVILAKAPVPGRAKTRLCPPCTPEEAARLAEAALRDTLDVVIRTIASRVVLVLDGEAPAGLHRPVEVLPQRGDGLGERLAAAFADVDGPALLIGMDTPQVPAGVLDEALLRVGCGTPVLGPALDGGWWALGLPWCPAGAFVDVPMSVATTAERQRDRLRACGLEPAGLPRLRDVDHWADALSVAAAAPRGRFAREVGSIERRLDAVAS